MKRGFTLLELIVVIIVLGILASFAIPQFINATEKARAGEALGLLPTIAQAQIRYATEYGDYTTVLTSLDTEIPANPRYFSITLESPMPGLDADGEGNDPVGYLTRTTANRPGNRGGYILTICENGRVYCIAGKSGDCVAIGQGERENVFCPTDDT